MEEKTISFITSVKICKGYHDFGHRIRLYIENISFHCKQCNIDFEVLIGEDIDDKKLTIALHGMIKDLLNTSQLSSHDKVALLKQLTLDSIYSVLTQVIDNLEEKNKKRFQEKYK